MKPLLFLGLLLCNLVWSANPVMAKLLMRDLEGIHVSWLRSTSALLAFGLALLFGRSGLGRGFLRPASARDAAWVVARGFFSFCFAPGLALVGLESSRAVDNALIIAIEPLVTVLMAWVFLGEGLRLYHWVSFAVALQGFSWLSGLTWDRVRGSWDAHLVGNLLMLLSLAGEAVYSVFARKLLGRYRPLQIFGTAILVGVVLLSVIVFARAGLPPLGRIQPTSWLALLWLGPIGTTCTYLFWMTVLQDAAIPSMALTLFLQPVAGSMWGYLWLGERLSGVQAAGGGLILLSVAVPVLVGRVGRSRPEV